MMNSAAYRASIIQRQQQIQRQQEVARAAQREAVRQAQQEAARRAQQEAARRAQQAAAQRAQQEAARRAQQQAAQRAQQQAARRVQQQQAAQRAQQQAARRVQQQQAAKHQQNMKQKSASVRSQEVARRIQQQNAKAMERGRHEKRVAEGRAIKTRVHQVTSTRLHTTNQKNNQQKAIVRNAAVRRNQSVAAKANKSLPKWPKGLSSKEKAKELIQRYKAKQVLPQKSTTTTQPNTKGDKQQTSMPKGADLRSVKQKVASRQTQINRGHGHLKQSAQVKSSIDSKAKAQQLIKKYKTAQAAKANSSKKAKLKSLIEKFKAKEKNEKLRKQVQAKKVAISSRVKKKIATTRSMSSDKTQPSATKSTKQSAPVRTSVVTRSASKKAGGDMLTMFNSSKNSDAKKGFSINHAVDSKNAFGHGGGGDGSGSDDESSDSDDEKGDKLERRDTRKETSKIEEASIGIAKSRYYNPKDPVRNHFNISQQSSTAKLSHPNLARNANAQINLNKKIRALQNAQKKAVRTEEFSDGRVRYYMVERASHTDGKTRGASYVVEHNPATGQVRSWNECYDHQGNVNRIHPKTIDGQDLEAQHYPPTKAELDAFHNSKSKGPK